VDGLVHVGAETVELDLSAHLKPPLQQIWH
jgi:hypothetical protein